MEDSRQRRRRRRVGIANAIAGDTMSIALQTNGKIVTAESYVVARYNPNGSPDTGFGSAGQTSIPGPAYAYAVALQTDGTIVAVGQSPSIKQTAYAFEVVSFQGDPIPVIGSFKATPNPVSAGSITTLTISNISDANPGSTITQVAIYVDSNGDGKQDAGDMLLGYATQTSPGVWTFNYTVNLPPGSYTVFAQAEDNYGLFSDPIALSLTVL